MSLLEFGLYLANGLLFDVLHFLGNIFFAMWFGHSFERLLTMNEPHHQLAQQEREHVSTLDPPSMAFLCRVDLQLSPGKLAVQCAHAAVASLQQAKKTHSRMVQRWQEASSRKVCLAVEDENETEHFLQLVQEASLPFAMIGDAGLTEVAPGTVTVLGVGPGPKHTMDSLFRSLRTYQ